MRNVVLFIALRQLWDRKLLNGIAVLGVSAGTFRITEVLSHDYHPATLTAALILLLAGVAGKSAQFPLHVWLPDAMEGPTPVSALIHAATMVNAGVYLIARANPLFASAQQAMVVIAVCLVQAPKFRAALMRRRRRPPAAPVAPSDPSSSAKVEVTA